MKKLLVSSGLLICLFAVSAFAQTPSASTKAIKKAEVKTETAKTPINTETTTATSKTEKHIKKAKKEKKSTDETK